MPHGPGELVVITRALYCRLPEGKIKSLQRLSRDVNCLILPSNVEGVSSLTIVSNVQGGRALAPSYGSIAQQVRAIA